MDKKIYVTKTTMPNYEDYCNRIKELFDTRMVTNNGRYHNQLEKEISKKFDGCNFTLFTNGHLALELAIKSMELTGEVITTPFTFVSTIHAISRNGLKPVFCDINYQDYTIDVNKIEELITEKTSAIIPVHVYGNVCNVEEIERIAKKYNLKVIYDAAHAFGIKYKNKSISSYGDASMFSFHATKVFNTIEGGGIAYKNKKLEGKLNRLKNFGIVDEDHILEIGCNAKMDEFRAIMGLCNLESIDDNIKKRKHVYELYIELLKDIKGIKLNIIKDSVESNYAYFPIVIESEYGLNRDEVYELLKKYDIYSRKYFYPLINEIDCYKTNSNKTPIAYNISQRVLTLPIYPELNDKNIEKICRILKEKK